MDGEHWIQQSGDASRQPPLARMEERGEVLVIDDDPAIVALLVALLRDDEGFAVRAAYGVAPVLAAPGERPPALILLDVTLPGEEVTNAAGKLRTLPGWERVPLLLCSGREDVSAIARSVGAAGHLRKPFDMDAVATLAERYAGSEPHVH